MELIYLKATKPGTQGAVISQFWGEVELQKHLSLHKPGERVLERITESEAIEAIKAGAYDDTMLFVDPEGFRIAAF